MIRYSDFLTRPPLPRAEVRRMLDRFREDLDSLVSRVEESGCTVGALISAVEEAARLRRELGEAVGRLAEEAPLPVPPEWEAEADAAYRRFRERLRRLCHCEPLV